MKKIVNKKRALEIINTFSLSKVLIVGDMMVDHFIWGNVSRISPEAPVSVVEGHSDNLMLGGCANVMNNICSLGVRFTEQESSVAMIWASGCWRNSGKGRSIQEGYCCLRRSETK